jgi:hypothetical protein
MYKLGLAAFLVVLEFLLARLTRLDMSRFLASPRSTSHAGNRGVRPALLQPGFDRLPSRWV